MYLQISLMIILFALLFPNVMILQPAYNQEDTAPTADAGSLQIVSSGDPVSLDGSNSNDPDGDELHYHWIQIAGKSVTLSNIHESNPMFTAPNVTSATNLKFALTTDDGEFISSPSYVDDTVNPPSPQLSTSK
jgi:K319-like protein